MVRITLKINCNFIVKVDMFLGINDNHIYINNYMCNFLFAGRFSNLNNFKIERKSTEIAFMK